MLKAVVFDFDGIIVDTEPIHFQAFQDVLQPIGLGYSWNEYLLKYIGFDDRDAFREAFASSGKNLTDGKLNELIDRKAEIFEKIVKRGVQPFPGVIELISSLSGSLPLALCSGALLRDIEPILEQFDLLSSFDVMVTADNVQSSKPDPESYILTLQRLAEAYPSDIILPQECLAIEDTPAGIASASGAGLNVMAITNSYPAERLERALNITDTLEGITLDKLRSLLA